MMKIIVGIIAIAALGGGAYMVMQKKSVTTSPEGELTTNPETLTDAGVFSGSIADLSRRGGSWKCMVDTSTAGAASSGTVYVSGAKVRADFAINAQGYGTMNAYMIADGEYTYSWSSMMPQGMKAKMTGEGGGGTATSGESMDANHSYSYECEAWSPDESLFVVPSEISFTTI